VCVNIRHQLLIRFGYDGARFHGLQPQKQVHTAGAALRSRLEQAANQRARGLNFSARTDAGVHAMGNVATCYFYGDIDTDQICSDIRMPRDDGLWFVKPEWVNRNVHARGSSRGKRYRYLVDDCCLPEGPDRSFSWPVVPKIDPVKLRQAAFFFEGEHDFRSFCSNGATTKNTVKTLTSVRIGGPFPLPDGSNRYIIEIVGNAFLRKMIRIIVGTLIEVGVGLRAPNEIQSILRSESRRAAGYTAPARGLTLAKVGFAWPADGSSLIPELAALF
jgi:tRNA pseudouridine38-40 synthase